MEDNLKLISKYLKRKKWVYDGTEYLFRDPKSEGSYIHSIIDCILPKKGQSYTRLKFIDILEREIMQDVYSMFDEKIGFEVDFFVDGKEADNVFISEETKKRIRKELKDIHWFKIKGPGSGVDTKFSCEMRVYPSFNRKIHSDAETIDFPYFYDIFNITYNDVPVIVPENMHREAKAVIGNFLLDSDLGADVADKFFIACEPDFQLKDTDLYIISTGFIRNIDGVNLGEEDWSGNFSSLSSKFFKKRV